MYWIIDRIEEDEHVVLENTQTQEIRVLPRKDLPKGAKSGDALIWKENQWIVDKEETSARVERINEKWNKLKKINSQDRG